MNHVCGTGTVIQKTQSHEEEASWFELLQGIPWKLA